jgi:hypothetical protein
MTSVAKAREPEFPDLLSVAIRAETRARLDQMRGLVPTSIMVRRILDDWFVQRGYPPLEAPLPQYAPQASPMPSPFAPMNGTPHVR